MVNRVMSRAIEGLRGFNRYWKKIEARFFYLIFSTFFCSIFFTSVVYGSSTSIVNSIKIQGALHVNEQVVLSHISIVPGKPFSDVEVDNSVKKLYSTGYFSDVKIKVMDSVLVIKVVENRIINSLVFRGNSQIKDRFLKSIVRSLPASAYDQGIVNSDVDTIKKGYASIGYSNASVDIQSYPVASGMLNLGYYITEGVRTKISTVTFIGNKTYSHMRLARVISTKTSGFLSFLAAGEDVYSKERLNFDVDLIYKFYYNRGYAGVKVIPQAIFNKKDNSYDLIFKIDEGSIYRVGSIVFQSTVQDIENIDFSKLSKILSGDKYSAQKIEESVKRITEYCFSIGKPFVSVSSRINHDIVKGIVNIEYLIDQRSPLYVERIEIRGGNQSNDYVIRRELDFSEGDPINDIMIANAKKRLMATNYFSLVDIEKLPTNVPDRIILVVNVQKTKTGEAALGLTYQRSGVAGSLQYKDYNFLEKGFGVIGSGSLTKDMGSSLMVGLNYPHFLGNRITAGVDVEKDYIRESLITTESLFASASITIPVTDTISTISRFSPGIIEYHKGLSTTKVPDIYQTLIDNSYRKITFSQAIAYDTLDSYSIPRKGESLRFVYEHAGLWGDSKYHKLRGKFYWFKLLSDDFDIVSSVKLGAGYIFPTEKNLNLFDQFRIDEKDLRGFIYKGIGPRLEGEAVGGKGYSLMGAEVNFPIPLIPQSSGLRGAFFVDSATLYGNSFHAKGITSNVEGDQLFLRFSAGAEIRFNLLGMPISIYYGFPLRKQSYDRTSSLGFYIGSRVE
ncbi:MAG: outer membrane protein assembly factor BamA [Candidatus Liberibacter ctenarytainae]|uniref:Outer membrane protein assembly factor BamA n=1 Tax=Candidatus Liberibacter ctenarytainae TaxID=2020335 RepID=A0A937APS4_9HYPH|nr:outer membrane protein assembly factor BamA [Candidatus Liberibacter ctenarytainae]